MACASSRRVRFRKGRPELTDSGRVGRGEPSGIPGGAPHILILSAPFYREISDALCKGAKAALERGGATWELAEVPGALEVPTAIRLASASGRFDGFVALGCVIRGETTHYETVAADSSRGLLLLGVDGFCIGNGILTVENREQALVRADPARSDKGGAAAVAALELVALARRYADSGKHIGFRPPGGRSGVQGPSDFGQGRK